MYKICIVLILSSIHLINCTAQQVVSQDKVTLNSKLNEEIVLESKYVYDYESIFSKEERKKLEKTILIFSQDTGNNILIATTHSIGKFVNPRSYAINLINIYKQETQNDDIVVIVVSKALKKVEIVTSNKAKQVLTDDFCKIVLYENFVPEFKQGNFYTGIEKGLKQIITKWK